MSDPPSAIAAERGAQDGKPRVTFRHAGDRFLLVEHGEMELDLQLNFRVLTANTVPRERGLDGLVDTGPGLRSNLIRYDPSLLDPDRLIDDPTRTGPDPDQARRPRGVPPRLRGRTRCDLGRGSADRYEYRVEDDPFDVESWMRRCEDVAGEADEHRRRREVASEGTPVP